MNECILLELFTGRRGMTSRSRNDSDSCLNRDPSKPGWQLTNLEYTAQPSGRSTELGVPFPADLHGLSFYQTAQLLSTSSCLLGFSLLPRQWAYVSLLLAVFIISLLLWRERTSESGQFQEHPEAISICLCLVLRSFLQDLVLPLEYPAVSIFYKHTVLK